MRHAKQIHHGTRTRYTYGCRCDACSEANRVYQQQAYRARKGMKLHEEQRLAAFEASPIANGGGFRCPHCRARLEFTTNGNGLAIAVCRHGHYAVRAADVQQESAA